VAGVGLAHPQTMAGPREIKVQVPAGSGYLNTGPGVDYVGDAACRNCHVSEYESFKKTGMGNSMSVPGPEDLHKAPKPVTVFSRELNRSYSVFTRSGKLIQEESQRDAKGKSVLSESHEIAYTVGSGDHGRSYLVVKGDSLFHAPLSYYTRTAEWDLTPGYGKDRFRGFDRPVGELCISCHSGMPRPVSGSLSRFQQPPFRFLPIGCERCHGPGALHVQQRQGNVDAEGSTDLSIVNPAKLPPELCNDVCAQCHFAGDARVLRPGKDYLAFRPGTSLDEFVAIFLVPLAAKGNSFEALDQFEQLEMSRCSIESQGRLRCISCHDPHVQLRGVPAVDFFRRRCLLCHQPESCLALPARRQATSPPDNCISCHMPQQPLVNIRHSSLTDHRILRNPSANSVSSSDERSPASSFELIYHTRRWDSSYAKPDLRSAALAYSQVAPHYSGFGEKGFALLEQAAKEFPKDAEVQAAFGLVLAVVRPSEQVRAGQALQAAIDLGSPSMEVRMQLANLRFRERQVTAAIDLYEEAIRMEPAYAPPYLGLERIYVALKDRQAARRLLESVLEFDPGNEDARKELRALKSGSGLKR
jgi:tetratricopeptide (TPR) repeat protein